MAEEGQSGDDRTETATARHVDRARDAGNVPVSRELAGVLSLAAVVIVISVHTPLAVQNAVLRLRGFLVQASDLRLQWASGLHVAALDTVTIVAPILAASAVAGSLGIILQTNFLLHFQALEPKWSRLSPIGGIKRIFGIQGFVELSKSLAKLALISLAMWLVIRPEAGNFISMPGQDVRLLPNVLFVLIFKVLATSLGVQAALAAIDLAWVRFKHARDLRMSKQDIRDEMKDIEGNPQVKARLRRIRISRARKNMMIKVPTATVVVTNPTHYAVALAYDRVLNPAPRIVAKGVDSLAARIRDLAATNRVPMVANPALARALYRLELDSEIPAEHFKAVAEIIAFVWRIGRRPNQ